MTETAAMPGGPGASAPPQLMYSTEELFFGNLAVLGFDFVGAETEHRIPFKSSMFHRSNQKAMEVTIHFLLSLWNPKVCASEFKECWPILDRNQARDFKKIAFTLIQKVEAEGRLPKGTIRQSHLQTCQGERFYAFMYKLSDAVLKMKLSEASAAGHTTCPEFVNLEEIAPEDIVRSQNVLKMHVGLQARKLIQRARRAREQQHRWVGEAETLTAEYRRLIEQHGHVNRECQEFDRSLGANGRDMFNDVSMDKHEARLRQLQRLFKRLERAVVGPSAQNRKQVLEEVVDESARTKAHVTVESIFQRHADIYEEEKEKMTANPDNPDGSEVYDLKRLLERAVSVLDGLGGSMNVDSEHAKYEGIRNCSVAVSSIQGKVLKQQQLLNALRRFTADLREVVPVVNKSIDSMTLGLTRGPHSPGGDLACDAGSSTPKTPLTGTYQSDDQEFHVGASKTPIRISTLSNSVSKASKPKKSGEAVPRDRNEYPYRLMPATPAVSYFHDAERTPESTAAGRARRLVQTPQALRYHYGLSQFTKSPTAAAAIHDDHHSPPPRDLRFDADLESTEDQRGDDHRDLLAASSRSVRWNEDVQQLSFDDGSAEVSPDLPPAEVDETPAGMDAEMLSSSAGPREDLSKSTMEKCADDICEDLTADVHEQRNEKELAASFLVREVIAKEDEAFESRSLIPRTPEEASTEPAGDTVSSPEETRTTSDEDVTAHATTLGERRSNLSELEIDVDDDDVRDDDDDGIEDGVYLSRPGDSPTAITVHSRRDIALSPSDKQYLNVLNDRLGKKKASPAGGQPSPDSASHGSTFMPTKSTITSDVLALEESFSLVDSRVDPGAADEFFDMSPVRDVDDGEEGASPSSKGVVVRQLSFDE